MKVIDLLILMMILVSSLSLAQINPFLLDTNVIYRSAPWEQSYPSVAFDSVNYFVIWYDLRNTVHYYSYHGEATAYWHIFGCRVTPQGVLLNSAGVFISYYINL